MKVYGWQGWRRECPPARNGGQATREICAGQSKAAVARAAGVARPSRLFNLSETGNAREIEVATARPGVVFWQPLDARGDEPFTPVVAKRPRGGQDRGR